MRRRRIWLGLLLAACSSTAHRGGEGRPEGVSRPPDAQPNPAHFALTGGTVVGLGSADVNILDGKIESVGVARAGIPRVDVTGRYLVPAFIDSHVHLTYYPVDEELLSHGVVAVVDLAAPLATLTPHPGALVRIASGPMVTAVEGYPTLGWGRDGYGLGVSTKTEAEAAVDRLFSAGASVIKTPFTEAPTLSDEVVRALVVRAHEHGLKVVAHALGSKDAERAAIAGVDILGHTPLETLDDATLAAFSRKAVVSTLAAFGGSPTTLANLQALRARGATVLYGTDLGNTRDAGIQSSEIQLLERAGLDGAAIIFAGTRSPAQYWGLDDLGEVAAGKRAALLVLAEDPLKVPETLAVPERVYIDGKLQR